MITFSELGKYGRLGNSMFQIASTIGLATKHGYEFGFPYWFNHDHIARFGSKEDCDIQSYFKNHLPTIDESKSYSKRFIHWGYRNEVLQDWSDLTGHMQSEKYFAHCEDLIRHYFTFDRTMFPELPTPGKKDIAIHVRLGDYDDQYHPRLNLDYYAKAMECFNGQFWIFSDDIESCRQMFGNSFEYVEGNHYMTDLYFMTKFDYHIIGNSTFSWWGSYLGESKKTVAPLKWFGPPANLNPRDIYRSNWVLI